MRSQRQGRRGVSDGAKETGGWKRNEGGGVDDGGKVDAA